MCVSRAKMIALLAYASALLSSPDFSSLGSGEGQRETGTTSTRRKKETITHFFFFFFFWGGGGGEIKWELIDFISLCAS